jgi:hypothetical protein
VGVSVGVIVGVTVITPGVPVGHPPGQGVEKSAVGRENVGRIDVGVIVAGQKTVVGVAGGGVGVNAKASTYMNPSNKATRITATARTQTKSRIMNQYPICGDTRLQKSQSG